MNKVAIVGTGISKFTKNDEKIEDVLFQSTKDLFDNIHNITQKDIDAVLVSTNNNSKYLSPVLAERAGIQPKIAHTIESLCNSGSNSIVSGYSYIASGLANAVLVTGGERYDSPGQVLEWDNARGEYKHPIFWATIFTKAYKRKHSIKDEELALVSVKNHRAAQKNPYAMSEKSYSLEEVLNSKKLTDDLRLLECSRPCTGGSSILMVSEKIAKNITDQPIWIKGIGQKTISASFTNNPELSSMTSTSEASKSAYKMANTEPTKIDAAEVHDAFAVCEPMALEALGLADNGKGLNMVKEMYSTNNLKVNPRGGLIGAGHPLGATGIAQTVEITKQLQQNANQRQIENPHTGLVHNMSAGATSSTVLILEN